MKIPFLQKSVFLSLLVFSFCLLLIALFKSSPSSALWKGYRTLYVSSSTLNDAAVLSILNKNGCTDAIGKSNQQLPIVSQMAPVQTENQAYLQKRANFFTDSEHKLMVFYVPLSQSAGIEKSLEELSAFSESYAGTDGNVQFPHFPSLLLLLFALFLFYFSKNKIFFASSAVPLVFFAFMRPFFSVCGGLSMTLYAFYCMQKIWGRSGFVKRTLYSTQIVASLALPFAVIFISSPVNSILYVLSLLASASAIRFSDFLLDLYYEKSLFVPVPILTARQINLKSRKNIKFQLAASLLILIFFFIATFASGAAASTFADSENPALPAPSKTSDSRLPVLAEFSDWAWSSITFPYRRAFETTANPPVEGETVSIPEYSIGEDGAIHEEERIVYEYNSAFKNKVFKGISDLSYPAVEKMLLKQGKDATFAYSQGSGSSSESFASLSLAILLLLTVLLAFSAAFAPSLKARNKK